MSSNFNLLFYLKKPRNYESGILPIYLRITLKGKRSESSLGREIDPKSWDPKRGRARGTKKEAKQLNDHLDSVLSKIKYIHTHMIDVNMEITADLLRDEFDGKGATSRMVLEIFQEHNEKAESLIGHGFGINTIRTFKSSLKHLREFLHWKFNQPDISIKKVDFNFIKNYDLYLRMQCNCIPISADKYVKHLKKMILLSMANGWITMNPFQHYKSTAKPSPRTFLTKAELSLIENKEFDIERLKNVRDIFIFCCYTGLAYADVQKLKPSEIKVGDDGELWIFSSRQKTETPFHIPLLKSAIDIINSYRDHPLCQSKSILLPVYTNQRMNSYLKEIADLCGIVKVLTFHMARHTFATTVTLSNGVPIETVSKMLGHNSIKTTEHYAKVLDGKIAKDMAMLKNILDKVESNKIENQIDVKIIKLYN